MNRFISTAASIMCTLLAVAFVSAQENKPKEAPQSAQSSSVELLMGWNYTGGKLIAMAEDFPEGKYDFKAQKDQRTFGGNLLHVAWCNSVMLNAIKGTPLTVNWTDDSLKNRFPAKADVVKYLKQTITEGAAVIAAQGDSGLTAVVHDPWSNTPLHGWFEWMGAIEHAGEHYGQLVVYYRLNAMVPPESRPR